MTCQRFRISSQLLIWLFAFLFLLQTAVASFTHNAANQLASWNGTSVSNDLDGNLTSGPVPSTGVIGSFTYDSRNRLTSAGGLTYTYNAEGQRIGIAGTETTSLVVDPNGAMSKILSRTKNGITTRYVYGAGLQYEVSSAAVATYYHYDQAGNTAALSNASGTLIERVAYSPYGTIRYRQSSFDTPFLFGGFFGVMTDNNGLLQMRARYYNPRTLRFMNADPAMDGWNWYAYANGNPVNWADPTGFGGSKVLDAVKTGLSFLGFLPVVGVAADLANAGISLAQGRYGEAALNAFSAIPGIGDAAAAGKLAITGVAIGRAVRGAEVAFTAAKVETRVAEIAVPQIVTNRAAGNAFRDELADLLRQDGYDVATEVYKKTPFGKRFIDIEVSRNGTVLGGIETKVGSSRYTKPQQLKDAWMKDSDGYIVNVVRKPK